MSVVQFNCFFFKQKTAYVMRISDWSSDVCSSDLGALNVGDPIVEADVRHLVVPGIGPAVAVEGQGFVLQQRLVAHHAVCAQAAQALGQAAVVGGDGAAFSHEIGQASCRASVVQYG